MNNIEMGAVTLPSLTPQALLMLTNDDIQLASDLWFLTNNESIDTEEVNRLKPMTGSRYSLLKDYKITEIKTNHDGSKKNATKDTLEILLNQSVFGRTGGMVRLPHSGFSIKLKPLHGTERIDLQHNIAENIIRLHRDLTGDIQTAIYVTVYEHIIDLFISKIEYTTVDVAIKNIKKYIRVKDLGIIKLALIDMIYPDGYDFRYVCGELKLENGKDSVCGNKSDIYKIRMQELLYLSDELTDSEYQQLMSDTKNSISIDEVKKYQERFKYNEPATFEIDGNTFKIDPGTIDIYIDKSKEWLKSNIIESPIFTDDMDIKILQNLIKVSKLGLYYYTISSIENNSYIASRENITLTHVNILSSREDFSETFIEAAKRSLLYSYYQLGIPKFTCNECTVKKREAIIVESDDTTEIKNKINVGKLDDNKELFTNLNLLDLFFIPRVRIYREHEEYIDLIDLIDKTVDLDGINIPLYMKMYLVKIKNNDDNYLKRQMINKAILKSYVTDTPLDQLDILTLSNYERYLDPSNYTSEQEYMIMYIEAKIKNLFGMSYDNYINSTIDRMYTLYNVGKIEASKQNNTLNELSNELGDLANGL